MRCELALLGSFTRAADAEDVHLQRVLILQGVLYQVTQAVLAVLRRCLRLRIFALLVD